MTLTQQKLDELLAKYGGHRDELLLIGIRDNSAPKDDKFNDWLGYATSSEIVLFPGTTDPGVYWTFNKINPPNGAAHLVTGFHESIYSIGKHFQWEALVQSGSCKIWRDNNNNFEYDIGEPNQEGFFGINFHHANNCATIGQWSAGCQVIPSVANHKQVLDAVKRTSKYQANHKNAFSYLLVLASDVV